MEMNTKIIFTVIISIAAIAGCSTSPSFQTGDDAYVTYDGLTRLDNTIMDVVWAREDIDLKEYRKVLFAGIGVQYRSVTGPYSGRAGSGRSSTRSGQTEFQLDAATRSMFEEEISGAFLEEIGRSEVIEVVQEIGPEVLLVRGGLLDVVSRVPPESAGRSRIFISSVGEATLFLEVVDPTSNTVLARAVDRRAGENFSGAESNRATNRADIRRLGRRWGRIFREALEKMLTDGLASEAK